MKLLKPRGVYGLALICLLCGCSKTPLTDEQIKAVSDSCDKQGKTLALFNSVIVNRADCVDKMNEHFEDT